MHVIVQMIAEGLSGGKRIGKKAPAQTAAVMPHSSADELIKGLGMHG